MDSLKRFNMFHNCIYKIKYILEEKDYFNMSKNKGTLVSSTIRPISATSPMATAVANELLGGYHTVNTIIDRDAITYDRRAFGMLVYVLNTGEFYQLKTISSINLADNLNWDLVTFSGGGGSSTEWLDSVISRSGTPPVLPSVGDRYLVVSGAGAWFGLDDLVVQWNGSTWDITSPSEGTTVRVDNETTCIYAYLNGSYPSGSWTRQDFVVDPYELLWNIESTKTINVGTNSEYLVYGDLNVDGVINTWGKVVVLNGAITGSGSVNLLAGGTVQQVDMLTEIYGGTGISIEATSLSTRRVSADLTAGSGISLSNSGNSWVISAVAAATASRAAKYVIQSTETITVPDYEEYWIYGDLTVYGTLDIGTYGKVVVANGAFVAATGSLINNMGNVEVYDLLTVADNNLKVDITEIKYGTANRILFESELKYVPLMGTYARVITESNSFVYSTSSSYVTSITPLGFENYLGVGTSDPLKKIHVKNSGIIIDGIYPEQSLGLGDPNYARFVINTDTGNTQDFLNFRHNLGTVLNVAGGIDGGVRYPGLSIGTSSTNGVLSIYDYSGNNLLGMSRLGSFSQTNLSNGFKFVNRDVDFGITTLPIVGSYWDDGNGVYRILGINDVSSTPGGTFGAGAATYDSNTGLLNQSIVQSDYVYASVWDFVNSTYNSLEVYTSSVLLAHLGLSDSEVILDDFGVKLTGIPFYANDLDAILNGLSSGYIYATTSAGVTTLCIVP